MWRVPLHSARARAHCQCVGALAQKQTYPEGCPLADEDQPKCSDSDVASAFDSTKGTVAGQQHTLRLRPGRMHARLQAYVRACVQVQVLFAAATLGLCGARGVAFGGVPGRVRTCTVC